MLPLLAMVAGIVSAQRTTLNVFAAASLKEALTTIARRYEATRGGVQIRLNFAGSQTLAAQINQGAPADVFASAAEQNLRQVRFDPASYRVFAMNRLEIAVRKGLGTIRSVRDLPNAKLIVIADPAVPVGRYTESVLTKASRVYGGSWLASVRSRIVSREQDVKSVLAKVRLGEADAGIVYVSDVASARTQIDEAPIPDALNEIAEYPIAIPAESANAAEAKHFIHFVLSPGSQKILEGNGFVSPTRPVASLAIFRAPRSFQVPLPLSPKLGQVSVQAVDERGARHPFRGVPVSDLPGLTKASSATFVGADRYAQTFAVAMLKKNRAILMRSEDGNYQLIVPGLKPSAWVNWLRRIELR